MTPTLVGRIQSRFFLLFFVGCTWTLLVVPVLPRPAGATAGDVYAVTFRALLVTAVVGVGWELLYHGLQQYRWEKDWPSLFGLLTGIPEGLLVWLLLSAGVLGDVDVPGPTFLWHFATTWIVVWLVANGPLRVVLLRWRFRGGRVV